MGRGLDGGGTKIQKGQVPESWTREDPSALGAVASLVFCPLLGLGSSWQQEDLATSPWPHPPHTLAFRGQGWVG